MTIISELSDFDDMEIEIPSNSFSATADDMVIQIPACKSIVVSDLLAIAMIGYLAPEESESPSDDMEVEIPSHKSLGLGFPIVSDVPAYTAPEGSDMVMEIPTISLGDANIGGFLLSDPRIIFIHVYLAKIAASLPSGFRMDILSGLLVMFSLSFFYKDPGFLVVPHPLRMSLPMLNDTAPEDSSINKTEIFLPDDLLMDIISLLPPKSLSRFLCVSKAWNCFIHGLGILHPMSGLLVDRRLEERDREIYLPFSDHSHEPQWKQDFLQIADFSSLEVIHSCNGLILLTSFLYYASYYYIYDVTTSIYVRIDADMPDYCCSMYYPLHDPLAQITKPEIDRARCYLAYDPCQSPPQYKVIRFTEKDKCVSLQIFSSSPQVWAKHTLPPEYPMCFDSWESMAAYHQGSLYMIMYDDHLIRFDIDDATFHLIDLPVEKHMLCSKGIYCLRRRYDIGTKFLLGSCIGSSRGHLYYAVSACPLGELLIYMLDEDDTTITWRHLHKINTQQLSFIAYYDYQPICFHPQSDVMYLSSSTAIFSYNPNTDKMVELCKLSMGDAEWAEVYWTNVFPVTYYI